MKTTITILFALVHLKMLSQPCGGRMSTGFYRNREFLLKNDTVNKVDCKGYYQGLHVQSSNEKDPFNDSAGYTTGMYQDGIPIGKWKEHCRDGNFSVGEYTVGEECSPDGKGGTIYRRQGIYSKTGVWEYYTNAGILLKTERYEHSFRKKIGWVDKTFLKNSVGEFVLIELETKNLHSIFSPFNKSMHSYYWPTGLPSSNSKTNFWKAVSEIYNEDGSLKKRVIRRKFFGRTSHRYLIKEYDTAGIITTTKKRTPKPTVLY